MGFETNKIKIINFFFNENGSPTGFGAELDPLFLASRIRSVGDLLLSAMASVFESG